MTTRHAIERTKSRLSGLDEMAQVQALAKAMAAARQYKQDVAICVARLSETISDDTGHQGDTVWAVIRNQQVVTLMLRPAYSKADARHFRVDLVIK